jgi:hypothetical protein
MPLPACFYSELYALHPVVPMHGDVLGIYGVKGVTYTSVSPVNARFYPPLHCWLVAALYTPTVDRDLVPS